MLTVHFHISSYARSIHYFFLIAFVFTTKTRIFYSTIVDTYRIPKQLLCMCMCMPKNQLCIVIANSQKWFTAKNEVRPTTKRERQKMNWRAASKNIRSDKEICSQSNGNRIRNEHQWKQSINAAKQMNYRICLPLYRRVLPYIMCVRPICNR